MDYKNVTIAPSRKKRDAQENSARKNEMASIPTVRLGSEVKKEDNTNLAVMKPREGNKYRYDKTIGRGGMKVVLQVFDNDTMRDVAMALLPDVSTRSSLELKQFLREARITASLEHPNIVPVHDIGLDSAGSPYFTMKLLSGETLASVLQKLADGDPEYLKRYSLTALLRIYTRICNAVAFAHSKGVLHLDLKPQNVQLGEYGEVLVLDWGLARKISEENLENLNSNKTRKLLKTVSDMTEENVKGTPGYMAPEQISKSKYACSPQTDIYALGAILYAMVTYKNPVQTGEVEQMLRDTVEGNIIRPNLRAEDHEVPFGIEAVVLKAMSLNPNNRYRTVKELRTDVISFMDGYDTKAEKAGMLKKSMLFIRRHSQSLIPGVLILVLSLLVLFAIVREANRAVSVWLPEFSANFQSPGFPADFFGFRDKSFRSELDWNAKSSDDGLTWPKNQWIYLREPFFGSIKIVCKLADFMKTNDGVELLLFSAKETEKGYEVDKPLYIYHLDLFPGGYADIAEANNFYAPRILASAQTGKFDRQSFSFEIICQSDSLSLNIDRKEIASIKKSIFLKDTMLFAAIRSTSQGLILKQIEVSRLAPPENTTLMLAGDTLLQEKLYEKAIQSYQRIHEVKPKSALAEKALLKAYLTASVYLPEPQKSATCLEIKKCFINNYPKFKNLPLLEADVCSAWKNKNFALAAVLLNRIFEMDPSTQIVSKILDLPHFPLSAEVANMLFRMIRRSHGLKTLNLSGFGLHSLQGLAGLQLISLDCSNNNLTSLVDLSGMPLESLNCSNNKITAMKLPSDMPLRYLDCSNNEITNFNVRLPVMIERIRTTGNPGKAKELDKTLKQLRFSQF